MAATTKDWRGVGAEEAEHVSATLAGFLRGRSANIYANADRIQA